MEDMYLEHWNVRTCTETKKNEDMKDKFYLGQRKMEDEYRGPRKMEEMKDKY